MFLLFRLAFLIQSILVNEVLLYHTVTYGQGRMTERRRVGISGKGHCTRWDLSALIRQHLKTKRNDLKLHKVKIFNQPVRLPKRNTLTREPAPD